MLMYELAERAGVTVFTLLCEKLDAISVPEVRPVVDQLVDRGGIKVVMDLTRVKLVDTSGVGVMVALFKRQRALGGAVRVAGLAGQPFKVVEVMQINRVIPLFPTVDEALKGF